MDRPAYVILPALLLFSACDVPRTWTEEEVRGLAADEAASRFNSLSMTVDGNAQAGNSQADRIKEQQAQIDDQAARIDALERRLRLLESQNLYR